METMTQETLWQAWPFAGPWRLTPLAGGKNNITHCVETPTGERFVLHIQSDTTPSPRLRYGIALLTRLQGVSPPFAVPVPIPARNGDCLVALRDDAGVEAVATLSPLLPGAHPDRHDLRLAFAAAQALAHLDLALAALGDLPNPDGVHLATYGELRRVHSSVSDPLLAIERLPVDAERRARLHTILNRAQSDIPKLHARLPQQLIHGDYDPTNILMEHEHVTAVLDFEFAGPDLRALDLVVALSWWPVRLMGSGAEWPLIDAVGRGYMSRLRLSAEEIAAFPQLFRLRDATSLIHRIGRYLDGRESTETIVRRVDHSLWREEWLTANQETLLQHARSWQE